MRRNESKVKIKMGGCLAVAEINRVFSPKVVDILGCLGYECVWIDMEHSDVSYEQIYQLASSARGWGMDTVVRIPRGEYSTVIKPLEAGAAGVVLPHCMDADDARELVRRAKFAPLGLRGMGGGCDSNFGTMNVDDYVKQANDETMLVVMIEDKEAVENVDDIAAVEGIDVLFVGPGDLSQSYGVTGQTDHATILEAMARVDAACVKHGKAWGAPPQPGISAQRLLNLGARFINVVSDVAALMRGYGAGREEMLAEWDRLGAELPESANS